MKFGLEVPFSWKNTFTIRLGRHQVKYRLQGTFYFGITGNFLFWDYRALFILGLQGTFYWVKNVGEGRGRGGATQEHSNSSKKSEGS